MTLQALSESNRRLWLEAMDGKEPVRICLFVCVMLLCLSLAPSSGCIRSERMTSCFSAVRLELEAKG